MKINKPTWWWSLLKYIGYYKLRRTEEGGTA
jgi:hypothetical protein